MVEGIGASKDDALFCQPFETVVAIKRRKSLQIVAAQLIDGDVHHQSRHLSVACLSLSLDVPAEYCQQGDIEITVSHAFFLSKIR